MENLESILTSLRELSLGEKKIAILFLQESVDKDLAAAKSFEQDAEEGTQILAKLGYQAPVAPLEQFASDMVQVMKENGGTITRQVLIMKMKDLYPDVKVQTITKKLDKLAVKLEIQKVVRPGTKSPTGQWVLPQNLF